MHVVFDGGDTLTTTPDAVISILDCINHGASNERKLAFCGGLRAISLPTKWSRDTHRTYPANVRHAMFELLCCHQRAACVVSVLPIDLLFLVLEQVADAPAAQFGADCEAVDVVQALVTAGSTRDAPPCHVFGLRYAHVLNTVAALPLRAQHSMRKIALQVMRSAVANNAARSSGIITLDEYVLGSRTADMRVVSEIGPRDSESGEFCIRAQAVHDPPADGIARWLQRGELLGHGRTQRGGVPYVLVKRPSRREGVALASRQRNGNTERRGSV
jgi:hypothetical protein